MAQFAGIRAHCVVGAEGAYGTPVTPTTPIRLNAGCVPLTRENVYHSGDLLGSPWPFRQKLVGSRVKGSLPIALTPENLAAVFAMALTTDGTTLDLTSYTIGEVVPADGRKWDGCKVSRLSLTANRQSGELACSLEIIGRAESTFSAAVPTYTDTDLLTAMDVGITAVGGLLVPWESLELTIENDIAEGGWDANKLQKVLICSTRKCSGSFVVPVQDATISAALRTPTTSALAITVGVATLTASSIYLVTAPHKGARNEVVGINASWVSDIGAGAAALIVT